MEILAYLIPALLAAVVFVLVRGLYTFTQDGAENRARSNRLMQWRVGLQFLAVIAVAIFVILGGGR